MLGLAEALSAGWAEGLAMVFRGKPAGLAGRSHFIDTNTKDSRALCSVYNGDS